ncbi:MAG TPA: hypothetical protein PKN95_15220 [Verrucomicrobiota bacterium]|nr:hypothetical protein [Verrucomicrobiota bacterium]HNT13458.1 hypothetical protein [Verrucomicrobiota bacterium]
MELLAAHFDFLLGEDYRVERLLGFEPVSEDARQLMRHGGDGLGYAQAGLPSPVEIAKVVLGLSGQIPSPCEHQEFVQCAFAALHLGAFAFLFLSPRRQDIQNSHKEAQKPQALFC